MLDFTTRRLVTAAAVAGALSLSACSAPAPAPDGSSSAAPSSPASSDAPAPAPDSAAPESAAPGSASPDSAPDASAATSETEPASAPAAGPAAVPYIPPQGGFDVSDPSAAQAVLAQSFIYELVTNRYSLSGQWKADGAVHANTAKLWDKRLSESLKAKLTAAGKDGDVSGFGTWAVLALPGPDSTEAVKASPTCAEAPEPHCLILQETGGDQGAMKQAGGPQLATMDQSVPNRVAFDYDVVVPVSLTEKGNAEGVRKGVLKVDLSFVPNPNPGAGGPEFLIDSIKNQLTGTSTAELAASPGLSFDSY
ncbi:hypothetical protein QFZ65_002245 [Arthrobacter sp. B3I9]|uniref:hypothetical protein n=1 Tax=Arthrobacter sp. B3I9 TaxID=3042270 RepID=UPI002793F229|nr:hypothetical protein [Arthrobacter sp. B3I9]MDQ0850307.1 hypothetical protein [Arthrobacter sp. B3I9]